MRVVSCFKRPRPKIATLRCGACSVLPRPGTRPGRIVAKRNAPSRSGKTRPKPRNRGSSGLSWRSSGWAYRPAAFACQISRKASKTGAPSPSRMLPSMRIFSPVAPEAARSAQSGRSRAKWKKGPTVCDAVVTGFTSDLHRRRRTAAQDDVEAVAERILGLAEVWVVARDQALAGSFVRRALKDRIECEQRVAGKVHLRHQTGGEGGAENREMNMGGAPGVVGVAPRIGAGLDRQEAIGALLVGGHLSGAGKIRIERRVMLIALVDIAAGGVALPELDQGPCHRLAVLIAHAAGHDDPLAQRLAFVLAREIDLIGPCPAVGEVRTGHLRERVVEPDRRAVWRSLHRAAIFVAQIGRLSAGQGAGVWQRCRGRRHWASSFARPIMHLARRRRQILAHAREGGSTLQPRPAIRGIAVCTAIALAACSLIEPTKDQTPVAE